MNNHCRKSFAIMLAAALVGSACAHLEDQDGKSAGGDDAVLALNAALLQSMIVDRDPSLFEKVAIEDFTVVAPGGLVENRDQAISGVTGWDVKSIALSSEQIVHYGDVAVVTGRLDIDGTMKPVGRWGPLKYMAVYANNNGEWRFVSRALTPCLDKLVEMGRC